MAHPFASRQLVHRVNGSVSADGAGRDDANEGSD